MKLFGSTALSAFIRKYFGDPDKVKGMGDGTVTGAISTVSAEVGANSADITQINKDLSAIKNNTVRVRKSFYQPKVLFVGDSQMLGWGGVTVFPQIIKEWYPDLDYCFLGGAGFSTALEHNFIDPLNTFISGKSATQLADYDIVCVCGGYNDVDTVLSNPTAVGAGIHQFVEKCNEKLPNAIVKIFCMPQSKDVTKIEQMKGVLKLYKECADGKKAVYIKNSEFVTHNFTYYQDDGIHLNQEGQNQLAKLVMDGVLSNAVDVFYTDTQTLNGMNMRVLLHNEITTVKFDGAMSFPQFNCNNTVVYSRALGTLPKRLLKTNMDLQNRWPCTFENTTYLGLNIFHGSLLIANADLNNLQLVMRLYMKTDADKGWAIDNLDIKDCQMVFATNDI